MVPPQLDRALSHDWSRETPIREKEAESFPMSSPLQEYSGTPKLESTPDGQQGECSEAADLRREDHRLRTLRDWPATFLDAERAARNGLYFFGDGDAVRCYFCSVELRQWKSGDDVEAEHGRKSPACRFLSRKPVGNVPSSGDVCDALASAGRPAHPSYMTVPARLASFSGWPVRMRQRPETLAEAGFYYTGSGDQTVCYHCGGGLQDWEDTDEPWPQHALWFDRCPYLLVMKGADYIRDINSEAATASLPDPAPVAKPAEEEENSEMGEVREDKLCKICYSRDCNVCFVPCGHVVACLKCANSLTSCPVCRQPYTNLVKLFYS